MPSRFRTIVGCVIGMLPFVLAAGESQVGWRGDGSGQFPGDPPVSWSRVSKSILGLSSQARKIVGEDAAGKAIPDGVIREWLVLGPFPVPDVPKVMGTDTLPNELQLVPDEGEKLVNQEWKRVEVDTATLNFAALFGPNKKTYAVAVANIHTVADGDFCLQLTHRLGARVVLNGNQVYTSEDTGGARINLKLVKGWNRLLLKISADDTQWWARPVLHAREPQNGGGYVEQNIAWMTPLPGARVYQGTAAAPGGPIVVGNKIFLTCEPHDLFCLSKEDGKILWAKSNSYFDALTEAEKKADPAFKDVEPLAAKWIEMNAAYVSGKPVVQQEREKLEKQLYDAMRKIDRKKFTRPDSQDVGYAGMTPASDGKFVYAWFASGVSACYDLDGNRQWIRIDNHETVEHGFTTSPLLVDGKFIVFMRELVAFDAHTGNEAWRIPIVPPSGLNPENYFHGSMLNVRIGDVETIVLPNGTIVRASDGKVLFSDKRLTNKQEVSSPIHDGGILCIMATMGETLHVMRLPETAAESIAPTFLKEVKIPTANFPFYYLGWHTASPLAHDGLIYLMNNSGVLTVVDEKEGTILYQKMLDLDPFETANEGAARGLGISPILAGNHLYFFGNSGTAVVLETGREFKQLSKNKIEGLAVPGSWGQRQDRAVACPFIDGKRIYYRTESGLYAIGAK